MVWVLLWIANNFQCQNWEVVPLQGLQHWPARRCLFWQQLLTWSWPGPRRPGCAPGAPCRRQRSSTGMCFPRRPCWVEALSSSRHLAAWKPSSACIRSRVSAWKPSSACIRPRVSACKRLSAQDHRGCVGFRPSQPGSWLLCHSSGCDRSTAVYMGRPRVLPHKQKSTICDRSTCCRGYLSV